jgi:hypothetical protein
MRTRGVWVTLVKITAMLTAVLTFGLPTISSKSEATAAPPKGGSAGGTVVEVDTNSTPQHIVVDVLEVSGSARHTFVVTEKTKAAECHFSLCSTCIEKENIDTNQHTLIRLDWVFPGDFVQLTVEVGGGSPWPPGTFVNIIVVQAREIQGNLATIKGSEILLTNGRKFVLTQNARFFLGGQPISPDKLQSGVGVVLRQNPRSGYVTGVEAALLSR